MLFADGQGSVGHAIYIRAARGGAQALGRCAGQIAVGKLADLVAIEGNSKTLFALGEDQILDGLVFASRDDVVTDVWSAVRHVVAEGKHFARDRIAAAYRKAMSGLLSIL